MIDMNDYQSKINELQEIFDKKTTKIFTNADMRLMRCALGANEEAGELAHVILKSITGTYGFDNGEKVREKATDAVIDMMVFGLQVLNDLGIKFEDVFPKVLDDVIQRNKNDDDSHIPLQR